MSITSRGSAAETRPVPVPDTKTVTAGWVTASTLHHHPTRLRRKFGGAERIGLFRGFFNRKRERRKNLVMIAFFCFGLGGILFNFCVQSLIFIVAACSFSFLLLELPLFCAPCVSINLHLLMRIKPCLVVNTVSLILRLKIFNL